MAKINHITAITNRQDPITRTSYKVYYESGRQVHYSWKDDLPVPVVLFLTSEKTTCETFYAETVRRDIYRQ